MSRAILWRVTKLQKIFESLRDITSNEKAN